MKVIGSHEISRIINIAVDAVDKSTFGPFYVANQDNLSQKNVSPVNWQIFTLVLSSLLKDVELQNPPTLTGPVLPLINKTE